MTACKKLALFTGRPQRARTTHRYGWRAVWFLIFGW